MFQNKETTLKGVTFFLEKISVDAYIFPSDSSKQEKAVFHVSIWLNWSTETRHHKNSKLNSLKN